MALLQSIYLVSRLRKTLRRAHEVDEEERHLIDEEQEIPQSPSHPFPLPYLEDGGPLALGLDDAPHRQPNAWMAQEPQSPLQPTYNWLDPADMRITSERPVAAGGFADVWEGVFNGHKVIVKSYRCYISFDRAQVISVWYYCTWWTSC